MSHLPRFACVLALTVAGIGSARAAGKLVVENPWVRTAPSGAYMLGGFAVLRNAGDAPLTVRGAHAAGFGSVELHETKMEGGMARMRPLDDIRIAPGESVTLAPGGKHIMLMQPAHDPQAGEQVHIEFDGADGSLGGADFTVRAAAPESSDHAAHHH